MQRSALRFVAFLVLALLGAPVAMHVLIHDLDDHHHQGTMAEAGPGDHEHPIVSAPAPEVPSLLRVALPVAIVPAATPATWTRVSTADRNVVSMGALRMDDDVGLQCLLSTFLI